MKTLKDITKFTSCQLTKLSLPLPETERTHIRVNYIIGQIDEIKAELIKTIEEFMHKVSKNTKDGCILELGLDEWNLKQLDLMILRALIP